MKHKYPFYATKVHKKNETGNKKNPAVNCGILDNPINYSFTTLNVLTPVVAAIRTI